MKMTDRFVVEEYSSALVRVFDRQLECVWVLPLILWLCINNTKIGAENNQETTEALYSNSIHCVVKG